MPKASTTFTRDLSHVLGERRIQMTEIYQSLSHTQGYGHAIPSSTIDTWRIVKARLDHLYDWCYEAKMSFEKISRSDDVVHAIERLEWTLKWETSLVDCYDDVLNAPSNLDGSAPGGSVSNDEKSHEEKRYSRVVRSYFWGHWKPSPQTEAYGAICRLQEHTRKKGGSTTNGFGEVLTEDDLRARDKVFVKHMKKVESSMSSAVDS